MAPLAILAQLLFPIVVDKVKEKLAEKAGNGFADDKKEITTSEVVGPVMKVVATAKLTWFAFALAVVAVVVEHQQLFADLIPADYRGYWTAAIGVVVLLLKNFATRDVEQKVADVIKE